MKNISRYLFLLAIVLVGCSPPLPAFPAMVTFEVHSRSGELISKKNISSADPLYINLRAAVESDTASRHISYASYVTAKYVFRSPQLVVSCYPNKIVLDAIQDGKQKSYEKQIPQLYRKLNLS